MALLRRDGFRVVVSRTGQTSVARLGPADVSAGLLSLNGYFDTPSQMPGALIEPLFLTDPFEGSLAASVKGQQVIAEGLAQAIEQYFSAS